MGFAQRFLISKGPKYASLKSVSCKLESVNVVPDNTALMNSDFLMSEPENGCEEVSE